MTQSRGATRLLPLVGALLVSGCWVSERYLVTPEQLDQARQVPAGWHVFRLTAKP